MRFVELRLEAFGPFTRRDFDFASPEGGVHLIYGPNEAGKSSTLRAITGLLYGFDHRSPDTHIHRELRVGALLETSAGPIEVVRRKGTKNTLLDREGNPLEESVLAAHLGAVGEKLFRSMYGLDQEGLRTGGNALLAGHGDVGEGLFDAAMGGRGVHFVLESLRAEADALFRPTAKKARINAGLTKLAEAQKALRTDILSPKKYAEQKQALEKARADLDALMVVVRQLREERGRLERVKGTVGVLAKLRELEAEHAALGDIGRSLDEADVDELRDRLGSHRRATRQLPDLRASLLRVSEGIGTRRERIGLSDGEALPTTHEQARLRRLASQRSALGHELTHAQRDVAEARRRLEAERARHSQAGDAPEPAALRAAVEEAQNLHDPRRRAELEAQYERAREDVRRSLSSLDWWRGDEESLLSFQVPNVATVERFAERAVELQLAEQRLHERQAQNEARTREVVSELDILRRAGDVPTEEELDTARAHRDSGWALVRKRYIDGEAVDTLAYDPERPLSQAFERATRAADDVADRLRREADRVARRARLEGERDALVAQAESLAESHAALRAELESHQQDFAALFAHAETEPLPPGEMRAWLERRGDVLRARQRADDAAEQLEVLRIEHERVLQALTGALEEAGVPFSDDAELPALRALATTHLAARAEARRARLDAERAARELEERVAALEEDLSEKRAALSAWQADWSEALLHMGFAEDAHPEEVNAVLDALTELARELHQAATLRDQIETIEREEAHLSAQLEDLAARHAKDLLGSPLEEQGVAFLERWARAREVAGALAEERARLAELGGGMERALLEKEAEGQERPAVMVRLQEIEEELSEREDSLKDLSAQIGGLEAQLERRDRSMGGVYGAAEVEEQAAEVHDAVERYVRLRLATRVLEDEIRRHQEEAQGPVLSRANELFPRLTCGAFAGLRTEFGDKDHLVLRGVRTDGSGLDIQGMSEGTRDQLYLALRLASLEHRAREGHALPLVLDDAFITFDDERARAALSVLDEVAGSLQVLFFTHHASLVELAREAIPTARLGVHELPRAALGGVEPTAPRL